MQKHFLGWKINENNALWAFALFNIILSTHIKTNKFGSLLLRHLSHLTVKEAQRWHSRGDEGGFTSPTQSSSLFNLRSAIRDDEDEELGQ